MRKVLIPCLFICFSIGTHTSCTSKFRIQAYDYERYARISMDSLNNLYLTDKQDIYSIGDLQWNDKSIILISDTTLNYVGRIGSFLFVNTIGYTRIDNILLIDSVDNYISDSESEEPKDILGKSFHYSKDSIVDIELNQFYLKRTKSFK